MDARWTIEFTDSAKKELRELDDGLANEALDLVYDLPHDPRPSDSGDLKRNSPRHKIYFGNGQYRLVYSVWPRSQKILVERLRPRGTAYIGYKGPNPSMLSIPNPSHPRSLRPVHLITDRAKRYRANRNPPPPPKRCNFCGSRRNVEIDHVDGNEANDQPQNKMWLCRSCNTRKGLTFRNARVGKLTRQYNPGRGATSLAQWIESTLILKGAKPGNVRTAYEIVHATPAARRSEFAAEIWATRRARGTDRWAQSDIPF